MTTDDPGWGGYVPPADTPRPPGMPPTGPPPPRPPWWQSRGALAVAAVVALALVGVVVSGALSGSSHTGTTGGGGGGTSTTTTTPTTTTTTSTPSGNTGTSAPPTTSTHTGPANADFIQSADAICTQAAPKIQGDLSVMNAPNLNALPVSTSDTSDLARDFGAVVDGLRALGNPPVDDTSFSTGVADWKQALDLLSPGDTEDFTINYNAGVDQFKKLGLRVCSGGTGT